MKYKDFMYMTAPAASKRHNQSLADKLHNEDFDALMKWLASTDIKLSKADRVMLKKAGELHQQELKKQLEAKLRKLFADAGLNYELEKQRLL